MTDEADALASPQTERTTIYVRVCSYEHKEKLERQAERLSHYFTVRGYHVIVIVKEIASGVNDSRPKLLALLADPTIHRIVVEPRDRLTRCGFR